jgi:hypothetical protein
MPFTEALRLAWGQCRNRAAGQDVDTGRVVARLAAAANGTLLLSSFSSAVLRSAAEEAEQLPRALLVGAIAADWRERMAETGAMALHSSARALTAETLAEVLAVLSAGLLHGQSPRRCRTSVRHGCQRRVHRPAGPLGRVRNVNVTNSCLHFDCQRQ